MKRGIRTAVYTAFILFSAFPAINPAHAVPISIDIQAQITFIDDSGGYLTGLIGMGDVITGTYTYESETPDTNGSDVVGDYWHSSSPYGVTLGVNGYVFRTDPSNVDFVLEVCNRDYRDNYAFISYSNLFDISVPANPDIPELPYINTISWQLDDPTATALTSTELPLLPPDLSAWQQVYGLVISSSKTFSGGGEGDDFLIRAVVFSATPSAPVPEPATVQMLASGIAIILGSRGLSWISRRKRQEQAE